MSLGVSRGGLEGRGGEGLGVGELVEGAGRGEGVEGLHEVDEEPQDVRRLRPRVQQPLPPRPPGRNCGTQIFARIWMYSRSLAKTPLSWPSPRRVSGRSRIIVIAGNVKASQRRQKKAKSDVMTLRSEQINTKINQMRCN